MKKTIKPIEAMRGIAVIVLIMIAVIPAFARGSSDKASTAPATETFDSSLGSENIGKKGPAGGIIIYYNASGFTVTGEGSFTANYLEAAPTNQSTSITWSSTNVDVKGAAGTAIGAGKANTAAIIAAHPGDTVSNNAAKAAVAYTGGGKNDWFLPSKDELNEIYKARTHLGISLGYFWSSSQNDNEIAWYQDFGDGYQGRNIKEYDYYVRAVRAF